MSRNKFKLIALVLILFGIVILNIHFCLINFLTGSRIENFSSLENIMKFLNSRIEYITIGDLMTMLLFLLIPFVFMRILESKYIAFLFSILFGWFLLCNWIYITNLNEILHFKIPLVIISVGEILPSAIYAAPWFALYVDWKKERIHEADWSPFELAVEMKNKTFAMAIVSLILLFLPGLIAPFWLKPFLGSLDLVLIYITDFSINASNIAASGSGHIFGMLATLICSPFFVLALIGGHLVRREHRQNPQIKGAALALAVLIIGYIFIIYSIIGYLIDSAFSKMSFG